MIIKIEFQTSAEKEAFLTACRTLNLRCLSGDNRAVVASNSDRSPLPAIEFLADRTFTAQGTCYGFSLHDAAHGFVY
jgi:hypothetical protein